MKNTILFIAAFFVGLIVYSQNIEDTIFSQILGKERKLKIALPGGYTEDNKEDYPVIYVMDGDYLFDVVASHVNYYSYWEDMPEAIVVGINQSQYRENDLAYSNQNSLPIDSGANFFEFIENELTSYIDKNYKTKAFRAIIGHGKTANFINYFLIRKKLSFNAYISISPDFAIDMPEYILKSIQSLEQKVFYYMAVSNTDVSFIMEDTKALNSKIKEIKNTNLLYTFNTFNNVGHYKMPAYTIPKALDKIFFTFQPISKQEYKTLILKLESSPVAYLVQKYNDTKTLFGIEKQILINDFKAIAAAIKTKEQWQYYKELSQLARKQYPETVLSNYYLGLYYEKKGEPKKAMRLYKDAYVLESVDGITKDDLLRKIELIKADLGY